ncbi:MAG: CBS domain-containing protein, partial [Halorientalis sp.]
DDDWKWESVKAVGNSYMPTRNVEIPAEAVREFMTEGLITVSKRRTAQDAAQLMIDNDIEQIPLVGGDTLEGIVQDIDLLRAL